MQREHPNPSVRFFERQFRGQAEAGDFRLNPFELAALPHLHGRMLDLGCGMGNLSIEAARRGCRVLALDASETAIVSLRERAALAGLDVDARRADLAKWTIDEDFDAIACIGLLMFFDCDTARSVLRHVRERVRPGGVAIVNVLCEGTTYLDMFDPSAFCLFGRNELEQRFADWRIVEARLDEFPAPGQTSKVFSTVIALRPPA
ncbi:MAG TPA: class I SAM-dependent methyltransferase [Burkholderiaceae bacterium]|nr:class I SAM-dependent methyltransferase [Burkholderiaceae bacterium]